MNDTLQNSNEGKKDEDKIILKSELEQFMYHKYLNVKPHTFKGIPKEFYQISRVFNSKTFKFDLKLTCLIDGCGKTFNKSCNIKDHIRLHSGIKAFKCEECTKTFSQKGNLKKHVQLMHVNKNGSTKS